jgi:hypothetical protein
LTSIAAARTSDGGQYFDISAIDRRQGVEVDDRRWPGACAERFQRTAEGCFTRSVTSP